MFKKIKNKLFQSDKKYLAYIGLFLMIAAITYGAITMSPNQYKGELRIAPEVIERMNSWEPQMIDTSQLELIKVKGMLTVAKTSNVVSQMYKEGTKKADTFGIALTAKGDNITVKQMSFNLYGDDDGNFADMSNNKNNATGDVDAFQLTKKAYLYNKGNNQIASSKIATSSSSTAFMPEGNAYSVITFKKPITVKKGKTKTFTVKLDLMNNIQGQKYLAMDMNLAIHIYAENSKKQQIVANNGNLNKYLYPNPVITIQGGNCKVLNRAEMVKIIINNIGGLTGYKAPFTQTFPDVPKTAWYFDYVEAAVQLGIVSGYSTGKFGPGDLVTKAQYAKVAAYGYSIPFYSPAKPSFVDVPKSAWYFGYVEGVLKYGYIKKKGNKFYPNAYATSCMVLYPPQP